MKAALVLLLLACIQTLGLSAQKSQLDFAAIIDIDKDAGTVLIRNPTTGRINLFKPDALELAELKVGDTVHVSDSAAKISRLKGTSSQYSLTPPEYTSACCSIVSIEAAKHDQCCAVAIVKNDSTGELFKFSLFKSSDSLLKVKTPVFTRESVGYAMVAASSAEDTVSKVFYGFAILPQNTGPIQSKK